MFGRGVLSLAVSNLRQPRSLPALKPHHQLVVRSTAVMSHYPSYSTSALLSPEDVREVQIPVPWGHIAGKWWGPTSPQQPLLCLHGWQDNAGTWDRLAPLLPSHLPLLSLDFPGHGLSSHFPPGHSYRLLEYVLCVRRVMHHQGWQRVSLLTHSLGSIVGFVLAALYPELVERYVAVDAMKPHGAKPGSAVRKTGGYMDRLLASEDLQASEAPAYTYAEAAERLVQGTRGSISHDVCGYLLKRGLRETSDGRFQYRRDARLKVQQTVNWTQEAVVALAEEVRCHVCHVTADPGLVYDSPESHEQVREVLRRGAASFEHHSVPGTHHIHLTEPEKIAPIVVRFMSQETSKY